MKSLILFLSGCAFLLLTHTLQADPGDTSSVTTFNREFLNWATPHDATFQFAASGVKYSEVMLEIQLGCPGAPGDCDPWDRNGTLSIIQPHDTSTRKIEIARFITPYDITGSGGPGTCGWFYDVTNLQSLFHDSVRLSLYIESWIGGSRGWLITANFHFTEGALPLEPYRVEPLWDNVRIVYGDPDRPVASQLSPVSKYVDEETQAMTLRVTTTGHGQGNTNNAAEFSRKWQRVSADFLSFQQEIWRDDCGINPCSPQLGTWTYNRAGWCPGSSVQPWEFALENVNSGYEMEFAYDLQPFVNDCRPTNPNCVTGVTCTDCQYNSNGHTEPCFYTSALAIFFREPAGVSPAREKDIAETIDLAQNYPNPFNPTTTIRFTLQKSQVLRLAVFDLQGREVARLAQGRISAGAHEIVFDGTNLSSGVYFVSLSGQSFQQTRKMLLLK